MSDKRSLFYDNSISSPIFERLQAIAKLREQNRIKTQVFLENVKSPNFKWSDMENNVINNSVKLGSSNCELLEFSKLDEHITLPKKVLTDLENNSGHDYNAQSNYNHPHVNIDVATRPKIIDARKETEVKNKIIPKFNYLKKGQGLGRYNGRKLKGFYKKNSVQNDSYQQTNELRQKSVLLTKSNPDPSVKLDYYQKEPVIPSIAGGNEQHKPTLPKNFNTFEVLEELVEHDSFISTSSKVNVLFQEDCSTPVPQKKSLCEHIDLTPISNPEPVNFAAYKSEKICRQNYAPVRNLFSNHEPNKMKLCGSPMMKNIEGFSDYAKTNPQKSPVTSFTMKSHSALRFNNDSESLYQSGILKKFWSKANYYNHVDKSSSPSPKVHFPNDGAKILEYERELDETLQETVCSDDTDYINISDLENLKSLGLNYNFEVVHEVSTTSDDKEEPNKQVSKKTFWNFRKNEILCSPKFIQERGDCNSDRHIIQNLDDSSHPSRFLLEHQLQDRNAIVDVSNICTDVLNLDMKRSKKDLVEEKSNDSDVEVKKLLLLSKVYDLEKEIKTFKGKNETMEKLIEELKNEKETLMKTKLNERQKNCRLKKLDYNKVAKNIKLDSDKSNEPLKNEVSNKLQKLNERLCHLETENNLLKRKVNMLKKKEIDLKKKQNELAADDNRNNTGLASAKEKVAANVNSKLNKSKYKKSLQPFTNQEKEFQQIEDDSTENFSEVNNQVTEDLNKVYISKNVPDTSSAVKQIIISSDSSSAELSIKQYMNGDTETNFPDKIVYFYSKEKITCTRFTEGKEVIEFDTGQKEIYFPDGSHQIIFPNKSCTSIYGDGTQKIVSCDGTSTHIKKDGTRIVEFPNGQKEVYINDIVERIYPDGTVKILYSDGTQETRYKNGRIRIKTIDGNVIMK